MIHVDVERMTGAPFDMYRAVRTGAGFIPLDARLECLEEAVVSRTPVSCAVGLCHVSVGAGAKFKVQQLPFAIAHTALVVAVKRDSAAHKCVTSLGGGVPGRAAPWCTACLPHYPGDALYTLVG